MSCIDYQIRSDIDESDEHTLDVLTSLEIGKTGGFAGYYGNHLSAYDVYSVGGDVAEKIVVLGNQCTMENIGTARVGNVTRHLGLEIRRAFDITLGARHQIPADGSAVTVDSRDQLSLVQGSFGTCRRGRNCCGEASRAANVTSHALEYVGEVFADSSAAVVGDSDYCLPFGEDRRTQGRTGYFEGVHGAHEAQETEDKGFGDMHLADGEEVDGCSEECSSSVLELEQ